MATETPQLGESWSGSSRLIGASSTAALTGTQQQPRPQLLYRKAANAATENMTQDAYWTIVHKTGSTKNKKLLTIWSEYIHIKVPGSQLTI